MPETTKPTISIIGEPGEVTFNFIRSPQYRNIHADGCFGSVTPRGDIFFTLFTERLPLPDRTIHSLTPKGIPGPEKREKRVLTTGIVREMEIGVTMSVISAKSIAQWLLKQVESTEVAVATDEEEETK